MEFGRVFCDKQHILAVKICDKFYMNGCIIIDIFDRKNESIRIIKADLYGSGSQQIKCLVISLYYFVRACKFAEKLYSHLPKNLSKAFF